MTHWDKISIAYHKTADQVSQPERQKKEKGDDLYVFESIFHICIVRLFADRDKFCHIKKMCIMPSVLRFFLLKVMELSQEQVRHIAKLARLDLRDEEVKKFSTQLTNILQYIEILDEVDTSAVLATNQVTGLSNVMREDVICAEWVAPEELLASSELPVEQDQIRVKSVLE